MTGKDEMLILFRMLRLKYDDSAVYYDDDGIARRLSLASKGISSLPEGIFDQLSTLTSLSLKNNQLSKLPPGVFDQLTNLTSLNLEDNNLTSLPDGIFDQLASLSTLDLEYNNLTSEGIPKGIFDNLKNLRILNFHDNELTILHEGMFDNLSKLRRLNLENNPLPDYVAQHILGSVIQDTLKRYDLEVWEPQRRLSEEERRILQKQEAEQKERIKIFNDLADSPIGGKDQVIHRDLAEAWQMSPSDASRMMKQYVREGKVSIVRLKGEMTPEYDDDIWVVKDSTRSDKEIDWQRSSIQSETTSKDRYLGRDVFLSYSSKDGAIASRIYESLIQNGIGVWFAEEGISVGADFTQEIMSALDDCKGFIVIITENSVDSPHVKSEINQAFSKKKKIIPIKYRIDEIPQSFIYYLAHSQWVDLDDGSEQELLEELVDDLKNILSR